MDVEPKLQVGDVVLADGELYSIAEMYLSADGQTVCQCDVTKPRVACSAYFLRAKAKEVHRPTPAGLVQVWPEVNG